MRPTTVLLPLPDSPTSAIVCPGATLREKPWNTVTSGRLG